MMMMVMMIMLMIIIIIMNYDYERDDNLDNDGGDFDNLDDIFHVDRDGSNDKSEKIG